MVTRAEHRVFDLGVGHEVEVADFDAVASGGVKRPKIGVGFVGHAAHVGVTRHIDPPGRKRQIQTTEVALTES